MKKKILLQFILIFLTASIVLFGLTKNVNATDSSITVADRVKKGDNFNVVVNIPGNAVGYQGIIKITYSDGSVDKSSNLIKMTGLDGDYTYPGNMSASFTAKVIGSATVSVEECIISDANGNTLAVPSNKVFTIYEEAPIQKPDSDPDSESNENNNSNQDNIFTTVNETVYVLSDSVNLRKSYSTNSEVIAKLTKGTKLTRTGTGSNAWSKVDYNGQIGYIFSQYITTTDPSLNNNSNNQSNETSSDVKFQDVNETLYAIKNCNLRQSWSTSSDKVGYLLIGDEVTRTGIADNGWSRIKYEGKNVYVLTALLSKDKPEEAPDNSTDTIEDNENEKNADEELLELENLKNEIGVLPEVGINFSTIVYIAITIVACLIVTIYFVKNKF